ncbi:MAG: hypothetical protein KAI08_11015, partial [Bacteroidales bacterium]|nr:hypothetical protein [Bacteroidales bacterium]
MSGIQKKKSALSVSEGVEQPGSINLQALNQLKKVKKRQHSSAQLLSGIRKGDISLLGQAITLV